ncbi:MAG: hypothetical protein WBA13_18185 [Microcoleaceae cyanobacterium]
MTTKKSSSQAEAKDQDSLNNSVNLNESLEINTNTNLVEWTEIRHSNQKLEPQMILSDGMVKRVNCHLKSDATRSGVKSQRRYVRFDRAYVINRLVEILKPLALLSEGNFNKLIEEVMYALHQSQKN